MAIFDTYFIIQVTFAMVNVDTICLVLECSSSCFHSWKNGVVNGLCTSSSVNLWC